MQTKVTERSEKLLDRLQDEIWGRLPERPLHLSVLPIALNRSFLSGKATLKQMILTAEFDNGTADIPFTSLIPNGRSPYPSVVMISDEKHSDYSTVEDLIDRGYAVFSFYYKDITEDNGNFKSGLFTRIAGSRRKKASPGKAVVWAWTAIRALEYALDLDCIDKEKIGVFGRGTFSLSALLAGSLDERFTFVCAEDITDCDLDRLIDEKPYLFCPAFMQKNTKIKSESTLLGLCESRTISHF